MGFLYTWRKECLLIRCKVLAESRDLILPSVDSCWGHQSGDSSRSTLIRSRWVWKSRWLLLRASRISLRVRFPVAVSHSAAAWASSGISPPNVATKPAMRFTSSFQRRRLPPELSEGLCLLDPGPRGDRPAFRIEHAAQAGPQPNRTGSTQFRKHREHVQRWRGKSEGDSSCESCIRGC